jgi:hypothetical protein
MPNSKSDAHHFGEKPLIDRRHRQFCYPTGERRPKYFPEEIPP